MKLFRKYKVFWNTINFFEYFLFLFRGSDKRFFTILTKHFKTKNITFTSSARGAIQVALTVLKIRRNDRVLIPPFLSSCVVDCITSVGTPSLDYTLNTKAILLYHHWGFMQNIYEIKKRIINNDIFIIEDCAHIFWGKLGEYEPGDFGDFATFSLSKIFKITYCGLLKINRIDLQEEVNAILSRKINPFEYLEHIKGDLTYLGFYSKSIKKRESYYEALKLAKWYAYLLASPRFKNVKGDMPQNLNNLGNIFKDMHNKFIFLLGKVNNKEFILDKDVIEEMAPLCFPYISEDIELLNEIKIWLEKNNIFVNIYNFDVNRNMLNPSYKRCIPLPLYKGIDLEIYKNFFKKFPTEN